MGVWYATREQVKSALDVQETARNNTQIDRALETGSRSIEALCHRRFYPQQDTRSWDWPNAQGAASWRLWLDDNELISLTSLTSGGTAIPLEHVLLEPNRSGPPFNRIELNIGTSAAFGGGSTHQQDITGSGLFGYRNDETLLGSTLEALDAAETGVDVDSLTSAAVGVGSVLRIDSERMFVTGRTQLATGQTLGADLGALAKDVTVSVQSGAAFTVDEVILIEGERMRIIDIAANTLIVKRGWDGSVLAAHTAGAGIYAPRSLTVQRGALGTTAAASSIGAAVARWDPPGPVQTLAVAEAINTLVLETAGYSRVQRSGDGATSERARDLRGIEGLRAQVYTAYGRKARTRGV
ncbi:hypothetical protein AB0H77_21935 [Streptomyces sp. NPDC050844]|uniref:hypothetical protein n=1 Tax=Streptomyces sp. NPDC050844 TaxID=3155790 RepID=UPI0033D7BD40